MSEQQSNQVINGFIIPNNIQEVYADGIAQNYLSLPNTRMFFLRAPLGMREDEPRVANLSVVIPTAALFEFVVSIIKTGSPGLLEAIAAGSGDYSQEVVKQLSLILQAKQGLAEE